MALNISDLSQWRERKQGSVTLGVDATTPITVSQEQLESGTYILGVQGVGKSSLLESIILQQIAQNESVVAIDPHGDMVREIIARMPGNKVQDTYLFDLKEARDWPFGMNLFALPRGQENSRPARDATRNQVIHAFERLWPEVKSGLYFGNVLRPIIATLIEKPELTLAHVPRLFYNDTFRSHYTTGIQNFEAAQFWEEYEHWSPSKRERYCDPLLDRIKKLLSDDIVRTILCQKSAKLDIGKAISEGKIFLLSLPLRDPAYEFAAPIIGTVFMTLLHGAIFSFGSLPHAKRPACTIVIDEFQNFVTEDNEQFFSEGRKYRVKQVLAHQGTHQLDRGDTTMKRTATSAYTIVCFRTNKDDAPDMSSLFAGMKRQQTNIYVDVLPRLETHPSAVVKEFYWQTVTQLQNQAKSKDTLSPVSQNALALLNDLLYYAQKEQRVDEGRLQEFLWSYGKVKNLVKTVTRKEKEPQWYEQEYQRITTQIHQETHRLRERAKQTYEQLRELFLKEKRLDTQISCLYTLMNGRNMFNSQRNIDEVMNEVREKGTTYEKELREKQKERRELYQAIKKLYKDYPLRKDGEREYFEYHDPVPRDERGFIPLDRLYRIEENNSVQLRELRKQRDALDTETVEILDLVFSQERSIRAVCQALIEHPLAADKADIPVTEIAEQLKGLPNYTALVKIESHIHRLTTRDLQQTHPAVYYKDAIQWRNHIIKQTKNKYCRGRATVEAEIAATTVLPAPSPPRVVNPQLQQPSILDDDDIIE